MLAINAQAAPMLSEALNQKPDASVTVTVGRSLVLRTPWMIERAAIASPDVADIQVLEPSQVMILGLAPGATDVAVWNEKGEIWRIDLNVELEVEKIEAELAAMFPGCSLHIQRSRDVHFITGQLSNAEQAAKLHEFLETLEAKYVDATRLPGVQQVQIQVRIAEANREGIRRLGINAFQVDDDYFGALLTGSEAGGALNPVNIGVPEDVLASSPVPFSFVDDLSVSPLVTLLAGFPDEDLELFVQALQEDSYLRILAEPNLVALSGEEASFLAGGEYPIPVVQSGNTGGGTSISVEYKEYGVRLNFTPEVLGENRIRLHVAPEVSEVTSVGAVQIEGFQIPAVVTRRAETTLEMRSGQSFAMAGLLNSSTDSRNSAVPKLGELPVLGPLFRSVRYQSGESELLVIVTANLVEPLSGETPPLPGDLHVRPNDAELYLGGNLEGRVPDDTQGVGVPASVLIPGRVAGPGGWATNDSTN
jgi:pilus assembly protein CpaC